MADYESRDLEAAQRLAQDDLMPDERYDREEARERRPVVWDGNPETAPDGPDEETLEEITARNIEAATRCDPDELLDFSTADPF